MTTATPPDINTVPHRSPSTLIDLLDRRTQRGPDELAYTFLVDGEGAELSLSYGELGRRAKAVAASLQRTEAAGERALLLYPPGLDYVVAFWGCLYAGVIAVPAYPPRPNRNLLRLRAIAADAGATLVLTTAQILGKVDSLLAQAPDLKALNWRATDNLTPESAQRWRPAEVNGDALAYLQYTSGSTSAPKGVMVSHNNVLSNSAAIAHGFEHSSQSISLSWLPHFHDMGLVDGIIQPLYGGFRGLLMSPVSFLQSPLRWLKAISKYQVTHSGGPNFAYDLCVRRIGVEERAALDLSSWSVAYNGAEPVRRETLERFIAAFGPCGFRRNAFYPAYGLAEATLKVSGGRKLQPPIYCTVQAEALERHLVREASEPSEKGRALVGCGLAVPETKVVIVEPESKMRLAPGAVGEIWVAGPGVARGYWNHPEETEQTFHARLADTSEGPFLRTGDLGFLKDDQLFVTGRLKDLIIIRGRNLYPQDIERTAEQVHPALKPGGGAAISLEIAGEERLILVHEVDGRRCSSFGEVIESVRQAVAEEHEVALHAVALLRAGSLPKTSSGKVQRRVCLERFTGGGLNEVARWQAVGTQEGEHTPFETVTRPARDAEAVAAWLKSQLASSLGLSLAEIDVERPLSVYGVDSLLAVELTHRIETTLGVTLPPASFLQGRSLRQLAELASSQTSTANVQQKAAPAPIQSAEYPLSVGQQALWFLAQLSPESTAYNIARALRVKSALDVPALERALQTLVARHASLRALFSSRDGRPFQRAQEQPESGFEEEDAAGWGESYLRERLVEKAHTPFDLERGPLLRVHLFKRSGGEYVLLLVTHHIVADFWSLELLLDELCEAYAALREGRPAKLNPVHAHYRGFVSWQEELLQGPDGERLRRYWLRQLAGELPALDLVTDRPRPPAQTYRGASLSFKLSAGLTRQLKALARSHGATLYTVLLAAFSALLHRYTGQEEILIASPTAGREKAGFAGVIGYFVNPVVIRTHVSRNSSFAAFLDQVRQTALDAFEHQSYPFARLVEDLQPSREQSRPPLFQAMFILQKPHLLDEQGLSSFALGEAGAPIQLNGLTLEPMALERRIAQFDLTLAMAEAGVEMLASLEYNTDLFDAATVERLAGHLQTLLGSIVAAPSARVSELSLLDAQERRLLSEWNQTYAEFPNGRCLHELIEEQVGRSPEAVAVLFEQEQLTYAELNGRANQLARHLRRLGVGSEVRVGVCLERSLEMVVGLLGILKAGGAYVPLDPEYPRERLALMLDDARLPVLLTTRRLADSLATQAATVVRLDADWPRIAVESRADLDSRATAENVAYVIYTSGSTGRPKGVMNTHRALCNRLHWMQKTYNLTGSDSVLQKTPFSFDVSVWEFFWPLMAGARLVLAPPGAHRDGGALVRLIKERQITVMHFVPAMLRVWLDQPGLERCGSLRMVVCSGEALPFELQERFFARLPAELHNLYGPTEAAIDVTSWKCSREDKRRIVPIGHAIANTQIHILDRQLQPVPVNVPGELHIGGVGLARGYLHRPGLTAEKFIPNPFGEGAGERLYRTGDLARYLPDGQVEFLGRLDHQVKLRGFRIELGEIEALLSRHEAVREVVVIARGDAGGERQLVAYVVREQSGPKPSASVLRAFLKEKLPDYMLPASFVVLDALPLTASGKVDRRALPAPDGARAESGQALVEARTQTEEVLAGIWSRLLGLERVSIHDNFFELGGHSLLGMQLISRAREALGVELSVRALFDAPTVRAFAAKVEAARAGVPGPASPPLERVSRAAELPLSFAQQRLWFLDQLEPGSAFYNVPLALRLTGELNVSALESSLNEVIRRHEILRTNFVAVAGRPSQVIAPERTLKLTLEELSQPAEASAWAAARRRIKEEAERPFDLAQGPLMRCGLLRLGRREHLLLLTMHHIITDGWSLDILFRELAAHYTAFSRQATTRLAEPPVQYADFAAWQRERFGGEVLEAQLAYWKERLTSAPLSLPLPTDRPRPPVQSYRGATRSLALGESLTTRLRAFSRAEGVTLFMLLLAAFQALLHRYTGQDDFIVGTPIANRHRSELEGMIGLFANTLALRADLSGGPAFRALLQRVRETTLGALAHQDLPFERLVEELHPARDLSRTPLFQVMFAMQHAPLQGVEFPGLELCLLESEGTVAKFDLTLSVDEAEDELKVSLEYNTDLFDEQTIVRMLGHFETLLRQVADAPEQSISRLPLLTDAERRQLLREWNDTRIAYPNRASCLHNLFELQAERTPSAVAVVGEDEELTYDELNRRANRLARYLRELGVGPEILVALFVEHSVEMLVCLLGVLKAGGAYVPLDSSYPQERLRLMLEDAQVKLLLTTRRLAPQWAEQYARVICVDEKRREISARDERNTDSGAAADNLAYAIYTSGSTGKPKGVLVTHRSVVNHCQAVARLFDLQPPDRVLQFAPLNFDVAVEELFASLSSGAAVILLPAHLRLSPADFTNFLSSAGVTILNLPASYWHQWVSELARLKTGPPAALRLIVVGSEKVSAEWYAGWREMADECVRWMNAYGLTETTITSTVYEAGGNSESPAGGSMPIGRPIANTEAYVLDRELEPVPVGVRGELYLGGECLARGYLNEPALTAECFVPHPFSQTAGARLYRTGDVVRYLPDGNLEFVGRTDLQLKVRGFRLEPGGIEGALATHASVREALVDAREDQGGMARLVAYVVTDGEHVPTTGELQCHLKESLPQYMIPSAFVLLDEMPLTPAGKVDREALRALEWSRPAPESGFVAPDTQMEKRLAEIWASVLGLERVGVHDNFFELGGDSILSIQIIARANQSGLCLTPKDLFQHQTIAGLAAVAGAGGRTPEAEQGCVHGPVPLTPIQCWFFEQNLPDVHHYNQALRLETKPGLDSSQLERAVQSLVEHHDALRLRFHLNEKGWQQVNAAAESNPVFTRLDVSGLSGEERGRLIKTATADLQASLNIERGPLVRAAFFDSGDNGPGCLLIAIHHLAVDGVSWRVLLEDLGTACRQLKRGEEIKLPAKTTSFKTWATLLQESARAPEWRQDSDYWLASCRGEFVPMPVDYPHGLNTEASARSVSMTLGASETRGLVQEAPAAYQTRAVELLLAAVSQAFARRTGLPALLIDLEGHGREPLDEQVDLSRSVGWFTALYPVRLELRAEGESEVLKRVKEQVRTAAGKGMGHGVLRYLSGAEAGAKLRGAGAEVSFNYLGQFNQALGNSEWFGSVKEVGEMNSSGRNLRSHLIDIKAYISDGQLQAEWIYSEAIHERKRIEGLADEFMTALRKLIAHCLSDDAGGFTPSDFPDAELSQEDLDDLMAELG
jgi:amino acid adenylation domain-containing protein/non-ribosomal peptide synthase protein (TIGR01720 family)